MSSSPPSAILERCNFLAITGLSLGLLGEIHTRHRITRFSLSVVRQRLILTLVLYVGYCACAIFRNESKSFIGVIKDIRLGLDSKTWATRNIGRENCPFRYEKDQTVAASCCWRKWNKLSLPHSHVLDCRAKSSVMDVTICGIGMDHLDFLQDHRPVLWTEALHQAVAYSSNERIRSRNSFEISFCAGASCRSPSPNLIGAQTVRSFSCPWPVECS